MPTPRKIRQIAVVTADIKRSSAYSREERALVDDIIRKGFVETQKAYANELTGSLNFRITAGDEFQWVVEEPEKALEVVTYLRAVVATTAPRLEIRFRASIGVGTVAVGGHKNSYEQDGEAFVRARNGLEAFQGRRGSGRWTKAVTGVESTDTTLDAILSVADYLFGRWSSEQWEAIRWQLRGNTADVLARRLGKSPQAVGKRLRTSGWPNLEPAMRLVATLLS